MPRPLSVALTGTILAATVVAAPASALAAPSSHHSAHPAKSSAKSHATTHGKRHAKGHDKHQAPAQRAFTAVGSVTSVDAAAGTLTLADKGGSRDLHGMTVTVAVPASARVTLDDAAATLSQLAASDHVVVSGTRSATGMSAARVEADSPEAADSSEAADSGDGTDPSGSADANDPSGSSDDGSADGTTADTDDGTAPTQNGDSGTSAN